MVSSIGFSLGIGSGIDTGALIEGLSDAAFAPKQALIAKREAANTAQISALAEASNAIDSFAKALSSLVGGGTLFTQPTVSDTNILTATALAGADIGNLSSQIQVQQLAKAQTLESTSFAASSDPVGQGDLTLTTAAGAFVVTIDASNDSLAGLRDAINAKNSGVTASIVTQAGSARLVLKGATGEANAFTLSVPGGTTSGLERFAYDPGIPGGMTAAQPAQDAIVILDGVQIKRATNSFTDVIDGVRIDLKAASPGTPISLGISRPTEAISQAVHDFVDAYNELHKMLAAATAPALAPGGGGPLRGDISMREMQRQLAKLTSTTLNSTGGPSTLAEIGVATNRDGSLRIDNGRLQAVLASDPTGVEAMFNPRQYSSDPAVSIMSAMGAAKPGTYTLTNIVPAGGGVDATGNVDGKAMISSGPHLIAPVGSPAIGLVLDVLGPVANATVTVDSGLGGALQAIRDALRANSGPVATTQARLNADAKAIAKDRETVETRAAAYHAQLVATFTAMEKRVTVLKATQSYMDQQIKAWNSSND